jgi:hypothetical protein
LNCENDAPTVASDTRDLKEAKALLEELAA